MLLYTFSLFTFLQKEILAVQSKMCWFVTGCDRVAPLGFGGWRLRVEFLDTRMLCTSSTCDLTLRLPLIHGENYQNFKMLWSCPWRIMMALEAYNFSPLWSEQWRVIYTSYIPMFCFIYSLILSSIMLLWFWFTQVYQAIPFLQIPWSVVHAYEWQAWFNIGSHVLPYACENY